MQKTTKFEPKKLPMINDYEKSTKQVERKNKVTFQNPFLLFLSFIHFCHGRKCNYHNVLSNHRKEYAGHDIDWNNIEIFHSESSKGKGEFMEMLYIKTERTYSINLKMDLLKYNGCFDSMIGYI